MIEFENVTKLYKTVIGVNDITLDLKPGAYGLLGPNGSGKTTMINLIAGQLRPTIGRLRIFGENPWRRDTLLRRIGICPAVDILIPNISALDWVRYLLELHGLRSATATRRAEESLAGVGMAEAMRRPIGTYSLGMRQRTKIAQSIAHDPDLMILDEPFNGLDPIGRHEMTEFLLRLIGEGKSILLASHLLHEVEAIKPSFLLISGGRLLASGSPAEVRSLLADIPNEVRIRVDEPKRMAPFVFAVNQVESVRVDELEQELVVATRSPLELSERLPAIVHDQRFHVHEIRTAEESLQHLFKSLMRIHRGEL